MYEMVKNKIKIEPEWVNFSSAAAVTAGIRKNIHSLCSRSTTEKN